jgi:hypothetical protein
MGSQQSQQKVNHEDSTRPFIKKSIDKIDNIIPFSTTQNRYLTQDSIVNSIIAQFATRSNVGLEKYGTTLDRRDLTLLDWIQHAQEEMMDGILYLEKIKKTMHESQKMDR